MNITVTPEELIAYQNRVLNHYAKGMQDVGSSVKMFILANPKAARKNMALHPVEFKMMVARNALKYWLTDNPPPRLVP